MEEKNKYLQNVTKIISEQIIPQIHSLKNRIEFKREKIIEIEKIENNNQIPFIGNLLILLININYIKFFFEGNFFKLSDSISRFGDVLLKEGIKSKDLPEYFRIDRNWEYNKNLQYFRDKLKDYKESEYLINKNKSLKFDYSKVKNLDFKNMFYEIKDYIKQKELEK